MRLRFFSAVAAATALVATPVAASAASVNPASSLSVAPQARAGSPAQKASLLGGGGAGIYALLIVAGIAAIVIIAAAKDDNPKSP